MLEHGYMLGTGETTFAPKAALTRGQLVTILYRIEGEPDVTGCENPFSDVGNRYYTDAILWAADAGIVKGISETTFRPTASVTREQWATILYRYTEASEEAYDHMADFPDASQVSEYAVEAINWALENGIINGVKCCDVTYLQPKATACRSQVAVMLYRYLTK